MTFRQKYGPWAVVWVIGVVIAQLSQVVPVGDPTVVALAGLVFTLLLAPFIVIGSHVRQVTRWEQENGIAERREAEGRMAADVLARGEFERRPGESLEDAARRLRELVQRRGEPRL